AIDNGRWLEDYRLIALKWPREQSERVAEQSAHLCRRRPSFAPAHDVIENHRLAEAAGQTRLIEAAREERRATKAGMENQVQGGRRGSQLFCALARLGAKWPVGQVLIKQKGGRSTRRAVVIDKPNFAGRFVKAIGQPFRTQNPFLTFSNHVHSFWARTGPSACTLSIRVIIPGHGR